MQTMLREYEQSRARLWTRIQSLNTELKENDALGNRERDILLLRRNLLMAERLELQQTMEQMRPYCGIGESMGCRC